ncbi:MAG: hypothetical protein K8S97_09910 [Anaerolineae bacterium]|nr:hypothetical protein [Anaerolineae bacterium]
MNSRLLEQTFIFTSGDIALNRLGELSPRQQSNLIHMLSGKFWSGIGMSLFLMCIATWSIYYVWQKYELVLSIPVTMIALLIFFNALIGFTSFIRWRRYETVCAKNGTVTTVSYVKKDMFQDEVDSNGAFYLFKTEQYELILPESQFKSLEDTSTYHFHCWVCPNGELYKILSVEVVE